MIERLIESSTEEVAREVLLVALNRYAGIALTDTDPWWSRMVDAGLTDDLRSFSGDVIVSDDRAVAALLSRAEEGLGLVDETPIGAMYYPHTALMLVASCAEAVLARACHAELSGVWEFAGRFARHVDWQLVQSRIFVFEDMTFDQREERLWLQVSRLTGVRDAEFSAYVEKSQWLGRRYQASIRAALASDSSADYVVVMASNSTRGLEQSGVRNLGDLDLRWRIGNESIYVEEASIVDATSSSTPKFLFLWCSDPNAAAEFLATHVMPPASVDVRSRDGAFIDLESFIEHPRETSLNW